jgi:hypothetical protein
VLGPKLVAKNGMLVYRHLPSQNSTAALVSIPSWWKKAKIQVSTAWLDEEGMPTIQPQSKEFDVSLPGDIDDITAELLLGGKRPAPIIHNAISSMVAVSTNSFKVLVEGENLWRSAVVTLGAYHSSSIYVLPNMKGIIATFEKVPLEELQLKKGKLRVWTSEGHVEHDSYIEFPPLSEFSNAGVEEESKEEQSDN